MICDLQWAMINDLSEPYLALWTCFIRIIFKCWFNIASVVSGSLCFVTSNIMKIIWKSFWESSNHATRASRFECSLLSGFPCSLIFICGGSKILGLILELPSYLFVTMVISFCGSRWHFRVPIMGCHHMVKRRDALFYFWAIDKWTNYDNWDVRFRQGSIYLSNSCRFEFQNDLYSALELKTFTLRKKTSEKIMQ